MSEVRRVFLAMCLGAAGMSGWASLAAQQPVPQPKFEIASVKPSDPASRGQFRYLPGGRVTIRGVNLRLLIQQAYDVRDFQIVGGPDWIGSDRYDIDAKPADSESSDIGSEVMKLRLQALIKDRFRLELHTEAKEMSRYELVIAKNGPKIKGDADAIPDGRMAWGAGLLKGQRVDIRFMTVWLSRLIEQPVADQTGLKGAYNFELRWAPNSSSSRRAVEPEPDAVPQNSDGPSIFTAIQEQLGLKLEPRKGPVVMLVIDHVQKPTPD